MTMGGRVSDDLALPVRVRRRGMNLERSSGILLHPTSLPGGRLGAEAYRFVDWLESAGQSWWQILPLGPPDEAGSPYRAASAFACWRGFLADPAAPVSREEVEDFVARHPVLDRLVGGLRGRRRDRRPGALRARVAALRALRRRARRPADRRPADLRRPGRRRPPRAGPSSSSRARSAASRPTTGARPASSGATRSTTGTTLRRTGYRWWIERFRRTFELVDMTRVDHFRGFVAYWAVPDALPDGAPAARGGAAPAATLFDAARGRARRAAADRRGPRRHHARRRAAARRARPARDADPAVRASRRGLAEPAARRERRANRVVYTGTHDNDTTAGWWATAGRSARANVRAAAEAAGIDDEEPSWILIRLALALAGEPRDRAGAGRARARQRGAHEHARASATGNWSWRLERGQLTPELAARLRAATVAAGR